MALKLRVKVDTGAWQAGTSRDHFWDRAAAEGKSSSTGCVPLTGTREVQSKGAHAWIWRRVSRCPIVTTFQHTTVLCSSVSNSAIVVLGLHVMGERAPLA